jgi:phosphohistidine phosphatase SixA
MNPPPGMAGPSAAALTPRVACAARPPHHRHWFVDDEVQTMRGTRRGVFLGLGVLLAMAGPVRADEAAAWAALKAGGHIALMRHAEAPGIGDPPGFRLEDCATQRNLDARGRADAQAAGERLRAEQVAVGRLLASPWCRCRDTAQLMRTGRPVEVTQAFGSAFGDGAGHSGRPAQLDDARRLMAQWRGPGNLLVVTHGATILALQGGSHPATSEAVVLKPAGDGGVVEVGRVRLAAPR